MRLENTSNSLTNFKNCYLDLSNENEKTEVFDYLINVKVFLKRAKLAVLTHKVSLKKKRFECFIRLLGHLHFFNNQRRNSKNIVTL